MTTESPSVSINKNRLFRNLQPDEVPSMRTKTVETLFQESQVGTVNVLALDCEGHDCAILKGLMDACKKRREWWFFSSAQQLSQQHFGYRNA
eukprot:s441_g11.t1